MWEHAQHFEASQRRSIRLLQKHAFVEISCGAQGGTHKWLQVYFSTLWIRHHIINRNPKDHSAYFDSTVPEDTASIPLVDPTRLHFSNWTGRKNFAKSDPAKYHKNWSYQTIYWNFTGVTWWWGGVVQKYVQGENMPILLHLHRADSVGYEKPRLKGWVQDSIQYTAPKQFRVFLQVGMPLDLVSSPIEYDHHRVNVQYNGVESEYRIP